ncbi:MAG: hypothetical protein LAT81_11430, partial [Oceanicaulis sp.]|nr:hypothetical protein [Oceanicaulis sp.]
DFGLILGEEQLSFELTGGEFAAQLGDLGDASAGDILIRYTNDEGAVAEGEELEVGGIEYTFEDEIEAGTVAFRAEDFSANVADFVAVSGNVGFRLQGEDLVAVGEEMSASLEVSDDYFVSLEDADFGLILGEEQFSFELTGGVFDAALGELASVSASDVMIQYTNDDGAVAEGEDLEVGGIEYSFDDGIEAGVIAFTALGFSANVADFVRVDGNIGFRIQDSELVATGNEVSAGLEVTDDIFVRLNDAGFGLVAGDDRFAFELSSERPDGEDSAPGLEVGLGPLGNMVADGVFVQYTDSNTTIDANTELEVGAIDYQFSGIEAGTIAFGLEGFHAEVVDFVTLSGDLGFKFQDTGEGTELAAVGRGVNASLQASDDYFVRLNDADFGLVSGSDRFAFELRSERPEGEDTAAGLELGLGPLADATVDDVLVQYTDADTDIAADTEVNVGTLDYKFGEIDAGTIAFTLEGLQASILDFITLEGSLGFKLQDVDDGSELVAVGQGVSAALEATDDLFVRLNDAEFGLVAGPSRFAFELGSERPDGEDSTPGLEVGLGPLGDLVADGVFVQYTDQDTEIAEGTDIDVGNLEYTFGEIGSGTMAFGLEGFHVNVQDFVTLSGDLGFQLQSTDAGTELIAVGRGVSASLEATEDVYARLNDVQFGLVAGADRFAFELSSERPEGEDSAPGLEVALGPLADMTSEGVFVQYTDSDTEIEADTDISVGNLEYTFSEIGAGTIAFGLENFEVNMLDFVSLSGSIGLKLQNNEIIAVGENVSASLEAGPVYLRLLDANFGMLAGDDKFAFETRDGRFESGIDGLGEIVASEIVIQFTNQNTEVAEAQKLEVGTLAYSFSEDIARDTVGFGIRDFSVDVADFVSVSGSLSFGKTGDEIVAAGQDLTAELEVGPAYVRLVDAEFGLVAGGDRLAFEMSNGSFEAGIDGLGGISVDEVVVAFTDADTTVDKGEQVGVAGVDYTFTDDLSTNTVVFEALGFEANIMDAIVIEGSVAFEKTDTTVVVADGLSRSAVDAETINLTGGSINVFVGVPGSGDDDRTGFIAEDIGFAFAFVRDLSGGRSWISAQAQVGEVGFVGLPETEFQVDNVTDVSIELNMAASDGSVVDYARTISDLGVEVGSEDTFILDIEGGRGEFIGAEMQMGLRVADFFSVSGTFAFEAVLSRTAVLSHVSPLNIDPGNMIELPDGNTVELDGDQGDSVSLLQQVEVYGFTIGAGNLNASAGIPDGPRITMEDVSFTFSFMRESNAIIPDLTRNWLSLEASAGRIALEGMPDALEIEGERLQVSINLDAYVIVRVPGVGPVPSPIDFTTIDFQASAAEGATFGSESTVILDMPGTFGPRIQASGFVSISAFDFLHAQTNIIYERTSETVRVTPGTGEGEDEDVEVEVLAIGATDTDFFVGFNPGTEDEMGFGITDASFVILEMAEAEPEPGETARQWSAIRGEIGSAGLVGFDTVEISGTDLFLGLNLDAADGSIVDFSQETGLPLAISDYGYEFDMARSELPVAIIGGTFRLRAFDLLDLEINLDITQSFTTVALDDGSTTPVGMFTFALQDLSLFVGYEDIGFDLDNASFGIVLSVDLLDPSRIWVSSIARTDSVGFSGGGLFEVRADDALFAVNTAARDGTAIDYSERELTLREGLGASVAGFEIDGGAETELTFDFSGQLLGIEADLTLDLLGVLTVEGFFSFTSVTRDLVLSDGSVTEVNSLEFTAVGVDGFLGFPGSDSLDPIGFVVEDLNFGLGVYIDRDNPRRQWVQLESLVGRLGFTGIPDVDISATDIALSYLRLPGSGEAINYDLSPIDFGFGDDYEGISMLDLGLFLDVPQVRMNDLASEFPDQNWDEMALADLVQEIAALGLPGVDISLTSELLDDWPPVTLEEIADEFPELDIDWAKLTLAEFISFLPRLDLPGVGVTLEYPEPDFGSLFQFSGGLSINLFDIVQYEDEFNFQLEFQTVVLSDGSVAEVLYAGFAFGGIDIFAGHAGVGLQVDDIEIAAALLISPTTGGAWVSAVGRSEFVGIVGVDGLDLQADSVELVINTGDFLGRTIDFEARPLEIPYGITLDIGLADLDLSFGDGSVVIDTPGSIGQVIQLQVGGGLMAIDSLVHLSGDFTFTLGNFNYLDLTFVEPIAPAPPESQLLPYFSIAATNVDAFLGFGGPYFGDGDPGDTVGIFASGVNFGLMQFVTGYQAFKLDIERAGIVGLGDVLYADLTGVSIERNSYLPPPPGTGTGLDLLLVTPVNPLASAIDFTGFGPDGWELVTPGESVFLDFGSRLEIRARVEWAELAIAEFLYLEGSFLFSLGERKDFVRAEMGLIGDLIEEFDPTGLIPANLYHDVQMMQIGAINVSGFAGIGESDPDSGSIIPRGDDRVGIEIDNANLGMAIIQPIGLGGFEIPGLSAALPQYLSVKASVDSAGLVGMDEFLEARIEGVEVNINTGFLPGLPPGFQLLPMPYIDFTQNRLDIDGLNEILDLVEMFAGEDALGDLANLVGPVFDEEGRGLAIDTGLEGEEIFLDFDEEIIQARVDYVHG